ncbi:hypothetical protein EVG20_g8807 [Dentipellis fragilis]|uniref:Ubiquitin-related modifier 1 n=1 Tax=Dentipellis fragilis TaxID=205917 RepID=A0A4Y9Y2S0_9AGAM|nr:hypothetical protein EVG20_g8807 [Dentipellis fragilis]
MDTLPFDRNDPAVRDYFTLIRSQLAAPTGDVARLFPTGLTPHRHLIAGYALLIYVGQIGYCLLLVFVRKPETKKTVVKGVGMAVVLANFVMAGWAVAWVFQLFLASTILLGLLVLLLIYANLVLLIYHPPTSKRPLDHLFIHVPIRLFLILPLSLLFPYSLFVTLGLAWDPAHPDHYDKHQWASFGVILGVNILALLFIVIRHDVTWAVGATWICVSLWAQRPKPAPVYITTIMFTVLHPLALVLAIVWTYFTSRREGRIALPPDEDQERAHPNGENPHGPDEILTGPNNHLRFRDLSSQARSRQIADLCPTTQASILNLHRPSRPKLNVYPPPRAQVSDSMSTISLKIEFGGGLELLFNNQRSHRVSIPAHTSGSGSGTTAPNTGADKDAEQKPADLSFLIRWLRDNLLTERAELFVDEGTGSVRPGILVLVNDTDWELEGEGAYEVQEGDEVVFISTLHGG